MSVNAKYAMRYAEMGWHVVPLHSWVQGRTRWGCSCGKQDCTSPAKHPIPFAGLNDSSVNKTVVEAWWKKWPWANVGIRTGYCSGLVILDIDPAAGGNDSFDDMIGRNTKLPDTVEVITGGGGRHIYFKHPGGVIRNSAGRLGPGLDIRADGGYVVAPGSIHASGKRYEFEASSLPSTTPIAEMPTWMLTSILDNTAPRKFGKAGTGDEDIIPEGYRNEYIASLVGTLHRRGVSMAAIEACVDAENSVRVRPPLSADEITKVVASILSRRGGRAAEWLQWRRENPVAVEVLDSLDGPGMDMPGQTRRDQPSPVVYR